MLRILFLLICLLIPAQSWASFTLKSNTENGGGGSNLTVQVTGVSVSVGDFVFAACADDTSQSIVTIDDGAGHNLTLLTEVSSNTQRHVHGYTLSSLTSGSLTYTCTYALAASVRELHIWVFTPSGSVSFVNSTSAIQIGVTAIDTGAVVSSGSDNIDIVSTYHDTSGNMTTPQIGGVASIAFTDQALMASWYNTQTGTVDGTCTGNTSRTTSIISAFTIAGGGGPTLPPGSLMMMGIGR